MSTSVPRPTSADAEAQRRRAVRAFVRRHHPDVGGDPVAFAAGLAALRSGRVGPDDGHVVFHRRPRGPLRLIHPLTAALARRRRPPRVH